MDYRCMLLRSVVCEKGATALAVRQGHNKLSSPSKAVVNFDNTNSLRCERLQGEYLCPFDGGSGTAE